MSLNINRLVALALPMIVILITQAVVMALWAYFVTFGTTGLDYDAAVMAAGHCGAGLGQTPNHEPGNHHVIHQLVKLKECLS